MSWYHAHVDRALSAPARNLAALLLLAALTTALLFNMQKTNAPQMGAYGHFAASLRKAIDTAKPPPPTAFDLESAMTPRELMARWEPMIAGASKRFGISDKWIRAVMRLESGGRTMLVEGQPITSTAGAMGLMQLMPATYSEMRAQYGLGTDAYDPHDNIAAGAAYLRWLYHRYGYPQMFAAYNDGPGNLEGHLHDGAGLPDETRAYVGGIAGILGAKGEATLTRPDGSSIVIDRAAVKSIRAPLPGEYADGVQSVIAVGKRHQGVRESVAAANAVLGRAS